MFEKFKVKRVISKTLNQAKTNHKEFPFLTPYTVKVGKWLEAYQGDTSRLEWLYTLLLDYATESELAGQHLYLDYGDYGNSANISLSLDEDGVFLFSDVLQDFLSLDEVRGMWKHLKSKNAMVRVYQDVQTFVKGMNVDELKEYRYKWENTTNDSEIASEVKENVFKLIDSELKKRKGLTIL